MSQQGCKYKGQQTNSKKLINLKREHQAYKHVCDRMHISALSYMIC